ncbi:3-deoxy-7-phosphoheptulonate synthase class II [Pseudactinotalea sp. HY160]|nr:3-deoxy-7-phosphoheptulonate synthase class II [Pseudactinotalea sp. HY158]MPV49439.1 3-deoxy-7-phosphoheptulonate synthase class II [Pseudactinotalea sp. HY160]QGH69272.1 3-deoxy-7-phosphoheptulonate synthase class II [Pseudactinotalea sp. HY158]
MTVDSSSEVLAGLDSWRDLTAHQQPSWPDAGELARVSVELSQQPPLVFAGEADRLRERMAAAGRGEAFVLQGGDCAETFAELTADNIRDKVKTILQMAVVLTYGASMPIVKMGRMAGQFAKPRSSDTETRDGLTLPAYRGDIINGFEFTPEARMPDPHRLLEAYRNSASTLNLIRAFTQGGFADLRQVHEWNRGFMANRSYSAYDAFAREIDRAIRFMQAAGADFDALKTVEFYSSHEGLLLDYERPLTRVDSRTGEPYACSGHFLWVGERTRQLDGAHVEFFSRVRNPLGVKLGPTTTGADAIALMDRLNPDGEPGRLTFITRMGAGRIRDVLPTLVEEVTADGRPVTWICDPMHGNGITSENGYKTRRFSDVIDEVRGFFDVHRSLGTVPGGLHVELTGDDVTEVLGGTEAIDDLGLTRNYTTLVDPRLNHQQSLEMAFLVAEMLRES